MKLFKPALVAVLALLASPAFASPEVIDFEFDPVGAPGINVNPGAPYIEDGFILTPANEFSAVFDTTAPAQFPGIMSDFFGFAGDNTITLARLDGGLFDLIDLVAGPSTISATGAGNLTIVARGAGGLSTSVAAFGNLTTATLLSLNFTNLVSVTFTATTDFALDDIRFGSAVVPLPGALPLFLTAFAGAGFLRRKRAA